MRPHTRQPTRLPRPWDSPGKNTGVGCHFLLQCMKVKSQSEVAQSCLTLCDPMDCSPPGSSVHGIFQARALEWGAIAFSFWATEGLLETRDHSISPEGWFQNYQIQVHTSLVHILSKYSSASGKKTTVRPPTEHHNPIQLPQANSRVIFPNRA